MDNQILKVEEGVALAMGWSNIRDTQSFKNRATHWWSSTPMRVGTMPDGNDTNKIPHYSSDVQEWPIMIEWLKSRKGHMEIGNKDYEWWINLPMPIMKEGCISYKIYGWGDTIGIALCHAIVGVAREARA